MLNLDFTKYSLVLIKDKEILFSSKESGLRPLLECIIQHKPKLRGCTLYDKVIGLASARLILHSNFVSSVYTGVISESAQKLLQNSGVRINTQKTVKNILNKDKTNICPMEIKAQVIKGNSQFFYELHSLFYPSN